MRQERVGEGGGTLSRAIFLRSRESLWLGYGRMDPDLERTNVSLFNPIRFHCRRYRLARIKTVSRRTFLFRASGSDFVECIFFLLLEFALSGRQLTVAGEE